MNKKIVYTFMVIVLILNAGLGIMVYQNTTQLENMDINQQQLDDIMSLQGDFVELRQQQTEVDQLQTKRIGELFELHRKSLKVIKQIVDRFY